MRGGHSYSYPGVLKRVAVKLAKTRDLRLLSSGPRVGLAEINLPPMQAGLSIMQGKVNPAIPKVVNQIAFKVIGNDMTVTFAAEGGQLQLNAFEPIIARSLFKSLRHLAAGWRTLKARCVDGMALPQTENTCWWRCISPSAWRRRSTPTSAMQTPRK